MPEAGNSIASSTQSSLARSDRSNIDFQDALYASKTYDDDATDMIRELAVELLDSVSAGKRLAGRRGTSGTNTSRSQIQAAGPEMRDGLAHAAALSQAPTIPQSMAVSPSARASDAPQAQEMPAKSDGSPIRCFTPSSPNSAASSTTSERKRRTRRSSARCADDEFSLREMTRGSTALGNRREGAHSAGCASRALSPNASVQFSSIEYGHGQDAMRSKSRSKLRPKSAATGPSYLQPSESYLRRLHEPRPKTPGIFIFVCVGARSED